MKQSGNFNYLTIGQIRKYCEKEKYVILRFNNNTQMAINTKVLNMGDNKKHGNKKTNYISYRTCAFQEYISNKRGFY